VFSIVCLAITESVSEQASDLNHVIFLTKKSFDFNHDLNQWLKSAWFKSANPDADAIALPNVDVRSSVEQSSSIK